MEPSRVIGLFPRDAAPSPSTPAEQFLNLVSDPFHAQLQGQAFVSSLITAFGATAIVALAFCFVRPYNSVVYAPRLRHADQKHAPPVIGKGPFAWVTPIIKAKEAYLVEKVGMDAAVFLRFTAMCRNMFLVLTVIGCAGLIPINIIGGKQFNSGSDVAIFMKMTPQYLVGTIFWWLVGAVWLINIVVCGFLYWNYRAVTHLRRHYFQSMEYQSSLHSRTIMVTDIPKTMMTDEGVVRIVDSVQNTSAIPRGSIGRNVKGLPDLIEEHEELVRQLEEVLAKYLKNPDKLPPNRPMCKPSKRDPEYIKGGKVDAINYLTRRVQDLEKKIKEVRGSLDQRDAMNYGFASYDNMEDAHSVAYAAKNKHPNGSTIKLAPRPSDIIWKNLSLTSQQRKARSLFNNLWVALLTLIWIVPNALIAVFLANLGNLGLIWPAFNVQLQKNPKSWSLVQGVLAPALTSAFYFVLPIIFRRLAMRAGDKTKTSRDRHVVAKLYAFFVFNNLIVFSVFSAVWQYAAAIINARENHQDVLSSIKQGDIWHKLLIALCNVSPFWASWLLQRNLGAAIDLAQVANLAWGSFKRRFMSPTPRQLIELSAPPPFDYASYYNYFLFYSTVALCFATIQPIVLPITAFYFCLDTWLKKYLLLYVFTTKTESGGRFWRILFNRMIFAVFLSNLVVAALVYAQHASTGNQWISMLACMAPLPILLILFKFYCNRTFDDQCEFFTRGASKVDDNVISDDKSNRSDRISIRFGHPAQYKPLLTPMVHAKAQHMLAQVYNGRLDDDDDMSDMASVAGYSDTYSMHTITRNHQRKASGQPLKSSPFEFVSEQDMDFENFKDRPEFRGEYGGDGDMYGRAEDSISRVDTPTGFRNGTPPVPIRPGALPPSLGGIRTDSRDSDRTLQGTQYPQGYTQTFNPSNLRTFSPSPDRFAQRNASNQEITLLQAAGPMGLRGEPVSRTTTPGAESYHGRQF